MKRKKSDIGLIGQSLTVSWVGVETLSMNIWDDSNEFIDILCLIEDYLDGGESKQLAKKLGDKEEEWYRGE